MCDSCKGIPEEQWTKSQREFVGSTFPTPKGGVLTVVGVDSGKNTRGWWNNKFILQCSICSKDRELWGDGSITSSKYNLFKGGISCGCTEGRVMWTEDQFKLRIQKECDKRGYIFHGWFGEYKKNTTKLDLENPNTGNRWQSTNVNGLFLGRGDSVVGRETIRQASVIADEQHIQEFHKVGFTKDHRFWRSGRKTTKKGRPYWKYTCPICSNDEYVKAGVCSGVFESYIGSLKKGQKACRCSDCYRWTQEQREYKINEVCKEEGLTFIGWETEEGYKNTFSKFSWICSEGHYCSTDVNGFLNSNKRCYTCDKQNQKESGAYYGYYPKRTAEYDNLYIINFKKDRTIKIGRAFDVNKRFKGGRGLLQASNHTMDEIEILRVMTGTHQEVYDTEQWIHEELTERGFHADWVEWTTECFTEDSEDMIYRLLDESGLSEGEW